jgi:hypothetical protein
MKRILGVALLLALLAVVAAVVWLAHSLDGIVKSAIEDVGSELLDTRVAVGSVSIDLREGRGTLRGLRIRNPEGFSSEDAISVGEVVLEIDLSSLTGSPIVLNEVSVHSPQVLAEANARGLNLDVLRRNVERSSPAEASDQATSGEGEPPRIAIRRFEVQGGEARSDTTALGGKREEIDVPGLSLRDVGGRRGAPPGELGKQILDAWLSRIARAAAAHQARRAAGKALGDALGDDAGKVGDALKGLLD